MSADPKAAKELVRSFEFRPPAIIARLGPLRPLYRQMTTYGHFGRKGLPWEE